MIEKCTLADVDALMADLRNMYVEMAPFGKMDEEKCISFLTDSIQNHVVLKKTEEEKLLGHMGRSTLRILLLRQPRTPQDPYCF
jgi:hypothetical protein